MQRDATVITETAIPRSSNSSYSAEANAMQWDLERTQQRRTRERPEAKQQQNAAKEIHTLKMKFSSFHAVRQRKDDVSNGTRWATARRDERHESVDCWWLSATHRPRRESRSRRTDEGAAAAAIGVRYSVVSSLAPPLSPPPARSLVSVSERSSRSNTAFLGFGRGAATRLAGACKRRTEVGAVCCPCPALPVVITNFARGAVLEASHSLRVCLSIYACRHQLNHVTDRAGLLWESAHMASETLVVTTLPSST
jgi:hypothetical protein